MNTNRPYKYTDKLMPELHEAFQQASGQYNATEDFLYSWIDRIHWKSLTSETKAYIMMCRNKFEELFVRPDPARSMEYDSYRVYEEKRHDPNGDRNKIRHKNFTYIAGAYGTECRAAFEGTNRNPDVPDLGVSGNQYVIRMRREFIWECKLFTEHLTEFYNNVEREINKRLKVERPIEINSDSQEQLDAIMRQGHRDVSELFCDAIGLFNRLTDKDLNGAPQSIVDFVGKQSRQFGVTFESCAIGVPKVPRGTDEATFCKILDKTIQAIKDFMRKFILEFRRLILDAADMSETASPEQMQPITDTIVITDAITTETENRDQPRFRFKFL